MKQWKIFSAFVADFLVAYLLPLSNAKVSAAHWIVTTAIIVGLLPLLRQPELRAFALPSRLWLDQHHFLIGVATIVIGLLALAGVRAPTSGNTAKQRTSGGVVLAILLALALAAGLLMELRVAA